MRKLYRITLRKGYGDSRTEVVMYCRTDDISGVHDDLMNLVELSTDVDIQRVKWWQWR